MDCRLLWHWRNLSWHWWTPFSCHWLYLSGFWLYGVLGVPILGINHTTCISLRYVQLSSTFKATMLYKGLNQKCHPAGQKRWLENSRYCPLHQGLSWVWLALGNEMNMRKDIIVSIMDKWTMIYKLLLSQESTRIIWTVWFSFQSWAALPSEHYHFHSNFLYFEKFSVFWPKKSRSRFLGSHFFQLCIPQNSAYTQGCARWTTTNCLIHGNSPHLIKLHIVP